MSRHAPPRLPEIGELCAPARADDIGLRTGDQDPLFRQPQHAGIAEVPERRMRVAVDQVWALVPLQLWMLSQPTAARRRT